MLEKINAAVMAAFAADALALGVHWIYNTRVIDKKLGRVETLLKPEIASFHRGKEKGDLTHYGDQMLVLFESVSAGKGLDMDDFAQRWRSLFKDYHGYVDQATRATLENFSTGKSPAEAGSASTDLGGASRIAPLLRPYGRDPEALAAAARAQTAMTHNHPLVLDSADFFARLAAQVIAGTAPLAAIDQLLAGIGDKAPIRPMIIDGLDSRDRDTREVIAEFGQMCEIEAALPATLHLIARYEGRLKEALVENVMAGGDSAARGMLAGMVLGAHHGTDAIPEDWLTGLRSYHRLLALM